MDLLALRCAALRGTDPLSLHPELWSCVERPRCLQDRSNERTYNCSTETIESGENNCSGCADEVHWLAGPGVRNLENLENSAQDTAMYGGLMALSRTVTGADWLANFCP